MEVVRVGSLSATAPGISNFESWPAFCSREHTGDMAPLCMLCSLQEERAMEEVDWLDGVVEK